jgi:EPS-associated MarR family transcriptional regulator
MRSINEHMNQDAQLLLADRHEESARLAVLRLLETQPELSQRELSHALGLSLGKTHYLLHALLDKGLLKVRNFRRSDHKMSYAYLLTPAGLHEKVRLTRSFVARKEKEFEALERTIAGLRDELGQADEQYTTRR